MPYDIITNYNNYKSQSQPEHYNMSIIICQISQSKK